MPSVIHKLKFIVTVLLLVILAITPLLSLVKIPSVEAASVTVVTQKWSRIGLTNNWEGGMVIGDVDNDGFEEIVYSGDNYLYVLNSQNGFNKYVPYLRDNSSGSQIAQYSQPQMNDIDGDGRFEIIVPLYYRAGILVLKVDPTNTALVKVWEALVQGPTGSGSCMSKPVIADIDGDGKSEIFIASQDVEPNGGYDGTVTLFDYLGNQLAQTFSWRSCSGGLSLADTDKDGQFELYMGDRGMYMKDGDYGKGVRSFWAENLTQRWNNPSFLSSSQAPVLADVNNDGILDVIVSDQRGGIHLLNSTTGAFIRSGFGLGLPVHYQLTVYDIDADGHLEVLMNDGDHSRSHGSGYPDQMYIFDLIDWKVDKIISLGGPYPNSPYNASRAWNNKFSPLVADIYDNGKNPDGSPRMEIITGANTTRVLSDGSRIYPASLLIFDNIYNLLQNVTGLTAQIAYPFVQDIDNDGLLELVIQNSGGNVRAYDTVMAKPAQRIRSEVTFFSERRMGAAVYVPTPWDELQSPLVAPVYPGSDGLAVPLSLQSLSFKLADHQGDSMSYTVTSSPNIGSGSGNGRDGVYTVRVTGSLLPYAVYTWTVTASDGTHQTRRTYSFKTAFTAPTGSVPSQGTPSLFSQNGINSPSSTFVGQNQSTVDADGDRVTNLYKWTLNGVSVANVLMPFNTRSDSTVTDYSGYGNNGVVHGATWTPNGKVGGAFSFDGQNDYITLSDGGKGYYNNQTSNPGYPDYHESLGGSGRWNEITVEHWIYLKANSDTAGSWRTIAKIPSYEIGFQQGSINKLFGGVWVWKMDNITADPKYTSDVEYTVKSSTALETGVWYHVVFTYKSNYGVRLYINGLPDSAWFSTPNNPINGSVMRSSGEPVFIGGGAGYFSGSIDEVRIYPRALSATQVFSRYQESRYGLSNLSLLLPASVGATEGSILQCEVIPSDSQRDGPSNLSSSVRLLTPGYPTYNLLIETRGSGTTYPVADVHNYAKGAVVSVDALPSSGYMLSYWLRNGTNVGSFDPYQVTMNENVNLTAVFNRIPANLIFQDGFETGGLGQWSGSSVTSGETVTVQNAELHDGIYAAKFTSNGQGGTERAYVYRNIAAQSELYVRGYFNINSGLPLQNTDNRFNLFALQSATGTVASLGVRRNSDGLDLWSITSVAGTWYASNGPVMNQWYSIEIYAKIASGTGGILRLWVNGQLVLERTGINTATVGNINQIRAGLAYVSGVTNSLTVYSDCQLMSSAYVGPEGAVQNQLLIGVSGSGATIPVAELHIYTQGTVVSVEALPASGYTLGYWLLNGINVGSINPYQVTVNENINLTAVFVQIPVNSIFQDGFETGSLGQWSGSSVTSGETVTVQSAALHHGVYAAKFSTNGGGGTERAFVYRNIAAQSELYVRGYFNIGSGLPLSTSNRFNIFCLQYGAGTTNTPIASLGVRRVNNVDVWSITSNVGGGGTYNAPIGPVMNQWYSVEFYAKIASSGGIFRVWVDGQLVLERTGLNTATLGNILSVRSGLVYVTGFIPTALTVYGDCQVISSAYIGPEGAQAQRRLLVGVSGSGSTDPVPGAHIYAQGASVSVDAQPATGFKLGYWLLNGSNVGAADPYTLTMNANYDLTAVFVPEQYSLTFNVNGHGSVTADPNQASYPYGMSVNLAAVADPGWAFTRWSEDIGGSDPATSIIMNGNKTVTASFISVSSRRLLIATVGSGTSNPTSGTYSYPQGEVVSVDAKPSSGFKLSYWLLNGTNMGSTDPYLVTLDVNRNLTAVFTPITVLFQDGFESGTFSAWTSTTRTTGETTSVVASPVHSGLYSAALQSDGGGGYERAYAYRSGLSSTELWTRAYVRVPQSGIVDNNDRFYFTMFMAGSNSLAYAGWRKDASGVVRWHLMIRDGTNTVGAYSVVTPAINTWYSVELHWKGDSVSGVGELYVDGILVASITGRNTSQYGGATIVRIGLPEIYGCASTTANLDDAVIAAAYIGP